MRLLLVPAWLAGCALAATAACAQSGAPRLPPTFAPADMTLKWEGCPEGLPKGCQLAVLNGDPAQPGADVFLKLPAKAKVPAHKHTAAERIVVVEGTLTVTYEGQKPVALKRGTYHYAPADAVHEMSCGGAQPCVLFIASDKPIDLILVPGAFATTARR